MGVWLPAGEENGELVKGRKVDTSFRKDGRFESAESGGVSPQGEHLNPLSLQEAA